MVARARFAHIAEDIPGRLGLACGQGRGAIFDISEQARSRGGESNLCYLENSRRDAREIPVPQFAGFSFRSFRHIFGEQNVKGRNRETSPWNRVKSEKCKSRDMILDRGTCGRLPATARAPIAEQDGRNQSCLRNVFALEGQRGQFDSNDQGRLPPERLQKSAARPRAIAPRAGPTP